MTSLLTIIILNMTLQGIEMADKMRNEGKIYVVVAIVLLILVGLITYLIVLDYKMKRLRKELKEMSKKE